MSYNYFSISGLKFSTPQSNHFDNIWLEGSIIVVHNSKRQEIKFEQLLIEELEGLLKWIENATNIDGEVADFEFVDPLIFFKKVNGNIYFVQEKLTEEDAIDEQINIAIDTKVLKQNLSTLITQYPRRPC